jgi:hypothetical protein
MLGLKISTQAARKFMCHQPQHPTGREVTRVIANVRFAPESGQIADMSACPLHARSALLCGKKKDDAPFRLRASLM